MNDVTKLPLLGAKPGRDSAPPPVPARFVRTALLVDNALDRRRRWQAAANDDGVTAALDRDLRDIELIAIVGGLLVLLLGIVVWVAL